MTGSRTRIGQLGVVLLASALGCAPFPQVSHDPLDVPENPSHTDFVVPIVVIVPPEGPASSTSPLPPCRTHPERCEGLLRWFEVLDFVQAAGFPMTAGSSLVFGMSSTWGRFVWTVRTPASPPFDEKMLAFDEKVLVVDAGSGDVLEESLQLTIVCPVVDDRVPVLCEGGVDATLRRGISSTTLSFR